MSYAERLSALQGARWKRYAPNPYRWYLRRLRLGRVLEVGCGVGRLLGYLDSDSGSLGVDTDPEMVARCQAAGLAACLPTELAARSDASPGSFDALVCAHVIEHLDRNGGEALLAPYVPYVRTGGRLVLITPQERGFASDPTHRTFTDLISLRRTADALGATVTTARSFPLPRFAGRWFVYNEFVVLGTFSSTGLGRAAAPAEDR